MLKKRGVGTVLISRSTMKIFIAIALIFNPYSNISSRSPFRKIDPNTPTITTAWQDDSSQYFVFRNSRLEKHALFDTFNESYFFEHHLPKEPIQHRYQPEQATAGAVLQHIINNLIAEIHAGKKKFEHFTVLKDGDFNYKKHLGLIVLRFNEHPFVVKIFMEHPQSLTNPYNKGFAPLCSFYSGGGINRHLIGFTRIKNLAYLREKIASDPSWSKLVDTPRKWFFLPEKNRWISLVGTHMDNNETLTTRLPGTYCIVADAIETNAKTSMFSKHDSAICLGLCKFLDLAIDPHINNFMWEKDTHKLVVIDTERFSTMMGFQNTVPFQSYFDWYKLLAEKVVRDVLFTPKSALKNKQQTSLCSQTF